jgi:hypothetical protein
MLENTTFSKLDLFCSQVRGTPTVSESWEDNINVEGSCGMERELVF